MFSLLFLIPIFELFTERVLHGNMTVWVLEVIAALFGPLQMRSGVGVLERSLPRREQDNGAESF